MVVIGFDPGSIRFGLGILKKEPNRILYLYSEEIKLNDTPFNQRMKTLWHRLERLYREFPIASAAIEDGFLGKNVKSMNVLSTVRGVVLGSLLSAGIDLDYYSPRQVKLALTGNGNAPKPQVEKTIRMFLNLHSREQKELGADESDALAVAYCHSLNVK
ncbi:MAG: crossover junction endodeoxyribonuclease RuvC [Candidatus Omnitrophota bacterium]